MSTCLCGLHNLHCHLYLVALSLGKSMGADHHLAKTQPRFKATSDPQDAKVALAYGPQQGGRCVWPRAHAVHSAALEGLALNTPAALAAARAAELQPGTPEYDSSLERLMRRIPPGHAAALQVRCWIVEEVPLRE